MSKICPICVEGISIDDLLEYENGEVREDEELCDKHQKELDMVYSLQAADEAADEAADDDCCCGLIGDIQKIQRRTQFDGTGQDEEAECEGLGY